MGELPPTNPYAAPQATVGAPGMQATADQYTPLFGRALAVQLCLGLFGVFCILAIVTGVGAGSSGQSFLEGWNAPDEPLTRGDLLEGGEGIALIASVIAVCFLLPRANRNARALTRRSLRFTPAATIWWFFVPFLNLVRPYQAVKEIWQASLTHREEARFFTPAPAWMLVWWGSWIAFNVLSRVTSGLARTSAEAANGAASLTRIAGLVSAACLLWTVTRIAKAQDEQAGALAAGSLRA